MKTRTSVFCILLATAFCVTPAFAITDGQPDGIGDGVDPNPGQFGQDLDGGGAPNSGDGISDGSGWDDHGAPNSGDGIPDGSGWDLVDPGDSGLLLPSALTTLVVTPFGVLF